MKTLAAVLALCTAAFGQASIGGSSSIGGSASIQGGSNVTASSLAVVPSGSPTQNVGSQLGLTATVTWSNGTTSDVTGSDGTNWVSSNPAIGDFVNLTATENVKCISAGTVSFTATYGSLSSSLAVTCVANLPPVPTPVSVKLTPVSPIIPVGQTGGVQFTLTETYSDNSTLNVTSNAVFTSGTTSVATIGALTATREVDCNGNSGTSVITATNDGLSDNTTLTCSPVVSAVTVTPATPSIVAGNTQQFIATCTYSDGSSQNCSMPAWTSSNTGIATVNSSGLAFGIAPGTTTIKAAIGAVSGTTLLTVTAPGPPPPSQTGTSVGPLNQTINKGLTLQYQALETFSDGSTRDCTTTATWSSTLTGVATISTSGLATAVANGTTVIGATCGGFSGTTNLAVQTPAPTLSSIAVTPLLPTQYDGSIVQFTATGTYSDGSQQNLTSQVTWASSNTSVATMSGSTATCIAGPTSVISATLGAVSGNTTLTCQAASTNTGVDAYCTPAGTWIGATVDGVAALPTACMNTNPANNPSGGTTLGPYTTTAQVQSALNSATCGQTITVTAGSALAPIVLPHKGCDNAHWITLESTGVSNPSFPAYGTRMTPCWSGVASLPGRPAYSCTAPTVLTFSITAPSSGNAITSTSGDHYIIRGAEITRTSAVKALIYSLVDLTSSGTQTSEIIFDRDYFHGIEGTFPQNSTNDTSTTRAVYLGQSNHVAMVNDYFSNFYDNGSVSSNGNTDSQCVGGGVGSIQLSGWGVYKFVNNHCEGGSEGLILGGGNGPAPTPTGCTFGSTCTLDVPTDIEIRQNYFFAPNFWNGNTTTIVSTGWPNRKNGFEIKTGARLLAEGNVMENCWYSSQPYCYVFDFAPKNQANGAGTSPTCPTCLVQDAVARYNYGYNYPGAFIAVYASQNIHCTTCTTLGRRIVIHDNLVGDSLSRGSLTLTGFDGIEFLGAAGPMTDINISHNTIVNAFRSGMLYGGSGTTPMTNFTFQNNLISMGQYGVLAGVGAGGCEGNNTADNFYVFLNGCSGSSWTANYNAGFNWSSGLGTPLGKLWPTNGSGAGNFFYSGTSAVGFTAYATDSGFNPSDYALTSSSPLHNAGSDGKDVGVDITTLQGKIAGVRE